MSINIGAVSVCCCCKSFRDIVSVHRVSMRYDSDVIDPKRNGCCAKCKETWGVMATAAAMISRWVFVYVCSRAGYYIIERLLVCVNP